MIFGIFFPISNYNGIINGFYTIILLYCLRDKGAFWVFSIGSGIFFYFVSNNLLYVVFDFFTVVSTIGMLIAFFSFSISIDKLKKIQNIFLSFYILNLVMALFPAYYHLGEGTIRFLGIFRTPNLSVSVMTIIGLAIWEIEKMIKRKPRIKIMIINLIGLIILIFATRTRTVLFIIPYWILQAYNYFNRRMFTFTALVALATFGQIIYESISVRMNFNGDESTATRAIIYDSLIKKILSNHIVIPYGSNESYLFIQKLTHNPKFSSHNDFLRYIYDWGAYFFIFLVYIITLIKKNVKFSFKLALIIIAYAPFALHNLLFLPIVWIPFCLILYTNLKNIEREPKQPIIWKENNINY